MAMVALTLFKTRAARTKKEIDVDLDRFSDAIRTTKASDKTRLPWCKLARFGDKPTETGCLRHEANMLAITGIEMDYDGMKLSPEWGIAKVKELDLEAVVYTSPSHTPDKPRWRLLLPCRREHDPSERRPMAEHVQKLFGGIFGNESMTPAQSYYYGCVIGNEANHLAVSIHGKRCVDELVLGKKNSFEEYGEETQMLSRLDAEAMLTAMTHRGDPGIHSTQLSVTASLLCAGEDEDATVAKVLEATRRVGEASWDWDKEERTIRKMCADWTKKQKKRGDVIELPGKKVRIQKDKIYKIIAEAVVGTINGDDRGLLMAGCNWHRCVKSVWEMVDSATISNWIDTYTWEICQKLELAGTTKMLNEVRSAVRVMSTVEDVEWDAHGKLAVRNGLLGPDGLEPMLASHMATRGIVTDYVPGAECPKWLAALSACVNNDTALLIQEIAGAALILDKPKALAKALVLVGPSNSGKTTLAEVLAGLVSDRHISTPLATLNGNHGTMAFCRDDPWLLDEAFEAGHWHLSAVVKQLLSSDTLSINVKNGPYISRRYRGPVFWTSNYPPQIKEDTGALANRLLIVELEHVFDPEDANGLWKEVCEAGFAKLSAYLLAEEAPGILNWALDGWKRLNERGYYAAPKSVKDALDEMRGDSNPVLRFVRECAVADSGACITRADFYAAFTAWWNENVGGYTVPPRTVAKSLRALSVADTEHGLNIKMSGEVVRVFGRIKLNDEGLDYWNSYCHSTIAGQPTMRVAKARDQVNRYYKGSL